MGVTVTVTGERECDINSDSSSENTTECEMKAAIFLFSLLFWIFVRKILTRSLKFLSLTQPEQHLTLREATFW